MENVSTVAESMFFYTSLLSPFQAKKQWHELYINLREWIFFSLRFFFLLSLDRQLLWHIGSVRNERYSCRHAILVMKSQLDLLHDWFCNLLFSGSSQNEVMSCWTSFKYPQCIRRNSGEGFGSLAVPDQGEGTYWPLSLRGGGERERERFVFKQGLEVGKVDRLSLHTTDRERERSVFDWDRAGERKTIYLHAIIAFTGIQNSIFLIWLKHRLQQLAENGGKKIKRCTRLEAE